jgi:hypothetical protein
MNDGTMAGECHGVNVVLVSTIDLEVFRLVGRDGMQVKLPVWRFPSPKSAVASTASAVEHVLPSIGCRCGNTGAFWSLFTFQGTQYLEHYFGSTPDDHMGY